MGRFKYPLELPLQPDIIDMELELNERELCRRQYLPFIERMIPRFKAGWHINMMAEVVHDIHYALQNPDDLNCCRRFIITMPPRHMKSMNLARGGPLWLLGQMPHLEMMIGTYASDLALEHGSWCKAMTQESEVFKNIFPDLTFRKDSKAKDRLVTTEGGGIRFVGRGGGTTGRGADLFVVDDPIKDAIEADSETILESIWKWYWSVVESREAPGGVIVVMHTRWRTNDLIGRLVKADVESGEDEWRVTNFPLLAIEDEYHDLTGELLRKKGGALHPARFNQRWCEKKKRRLAAAGETRDYLAIYQQNPINEQGNFFKTEHINLYKPHDLPKNVIYYIATDFAVSVKEERDFTCLWPFAVDHLFNIYFLADFFHGRVNTAESCRIMLDYYKRYNAMHIEIEAGVIRSALEGVLEILCQKMKIYPNIESPNPEGDKRRRAAGIRGMMFMNKVFFPDITRFHLLCMPEIIAFDKGEHDDIIDTISMAGRCVTEQIAPTGETPLPDVDDEDEDDEDPGDTYNSKTKVGRFPSLMSGNW